MAFSTCGVDNAIENASGDGNAKSPPCIDSTARWELRTAIAMAVSSTAAENWGGQFELHGVLFLVVLSLRDFLTDFVWTEILAKNKYIGISTFDLAFYLQ